MSKKKRKLTNNTIDKMTDTTDFKDYTCNAKIKARPMKRGEYNLCREWEIPADENPDDDGFLCQRADDSEAWIPQKLFLKTHFETRRAVGAKGSALANVSTAEPAGKQG